MIATASASSPPFASCISSRLASIEGRAVPSTFKQAVRLYCPYNAIMIPHHAPFHSVEGGVSHFMYQQSTLLCVRLESGTRKPFREMFHCISASSGRARTRSDDDHAHIGSALTIAAPGNMAPDSIFDAFSAMSTYRSSD